MSRYMCIHIIMCFVHMQMGARCQPLVSFLRSTLEAGVPVAGACWLN